MSNKNRKTWGLEEDDAIICLVEEFGVKKWKIVSDMLIKRFNIRGRTAKQCRERWHNHLAPEVSKKYWLEEEEELMFDYQNKFGNQWSEIAKLLPGRTDNAVKNHFYSTLRRKLRTYNRYKELKDHITLPIQEIMLDPLLTREILSMKNDRKRNINKNIEGLSIRRSVRIKDKQILNPLCELEISSPTMEVTFSDFETPKSCCDISKPFKKITIFDNSLKSNADLDDFKDIFQVNNKFKLYIYSDAEGKDSPSHTSDFFAFEDSPLNKKRTGGFNLE